VFGIMGSEQKRHFLMGDYRLLSCLITAGRVRISSKYFSRNSSHFAVSWPNHVRSTGLAPASLTHRSTFACSFDIPRGQSRSTSIRYPSSAVGGSYTRFSLTDILFFPDTLFRSQVFFRNSLKIRMCDVRVTPTRSIIFFNPSDISNFLVFSTRSLPENEHISGIVDVREDSCTFLTCLYSQGLVSVKGWSSIRV